MNNSNRIYVDIVLDEYEDTDEYDFNKVKISVPVAISIGIGTMSYYFERNDLDLGELLTRNPKIYERLVLFDSEKDTFEFYNGNNDIMYCKDTYSNIKNKIKTIIRSRFTNTDIPISVISDCSINKTYFIHSDLFSDLYMYDFKYINYDSINFLVTGMDSKNGVSNMLEEINSNLFKEEDKKPCLIHMITIKNIIENIFFKFLK